MAISEIDPRTAFVVIDLQEGFRGFPGHVAIAPIFTRAGQMAQAFRDTGLPVVLVTVEPKEGRTPPRTERPRPPANRPPGFADVVSELNPQPSDIRILKHGANAFHDTGLDEALRAENVTQVVVCGVTTSIGVESTVRAAFERGYNVAVAVDLIADREIESHDYSLTRVFPRMSETGTSDDILAKLPQPAGAS
jgi:nicotinamidase-related amidase